MEVTEVSGPVRSGLEDLMIGYQRADAGAAAELIRQVSPRLFRFLAAQVRSPWEAEDLLQECWLRIHRARHTYRPGEPLLPWMFAIARHAQVDGFRRRRRVEFHEVKVERLPEPAAAPTRPESVTPRIDEWLRDLPESQREVLLLLKVSGMSLEEVARATGATVGAVKQKAHRAYERLRRKLSLSLPERDVK